MKLLYLTYESVNDRSGISCKISQQVNEWERGGGAVCHLSIKDVLSSQISQVNIIFPITFISMLYWKKISNAVDQFDPDVIYIRQMLWFPFLCKLFGEKKLVIEINSNSLAEYKAVSWLKYLYHLFTKSFLLARADGFVVVSNELISIIENHSSKRVVIANGYSFLGNKPRLECFNERGLKFVFVGTSNKAWYGLDHIEKIADKIGSAEFHIVVPGYKSEKENVICYDGLYGDDLVDLYSKCDAGIGTMALYRNNMNEASPLKTREYIANGLPVIFAYHDTDLSCFNEADGLLELPNSPSNVDAYELIEKFANRWKGKRINIEIFKEKLSYTNKEAKRIHFFEKVYR